ncbi:MAG TPA: SDR family NAD(P)-dependent oxidoreductase [Ktedonobacterales bacterium]|nr:SDR family NAD(P)-dependent oxidoreductase [Ktedonobacterales bacterium]
MTTAHSTQHNTNTYALGGRVALIPGGLGGVGEPVTRAFVEAGANVVVAGNREHPGEMDRLRDDLGVDESRLTFSQADASNEEQVERLVRSVVERHGHLDILCNLIGGWSAGQPITGTDLETWQRLLDLNLRTAFLLAKHAARPMSQQGWGRILHLSSRGARLGRRNAAAYAVAKNAVLTLTEVQAEELRDQGITVNALLPSIVDTPANRANMPSADFGKWPKAEDIARVLLFLASDDAQLISGASIPVYGQA